MTHNPGQREASAAAEAHAASAEKTSRLHELEIEKLRHRTAGVRHIAGTRWSTKRYL
jgi:hypothetical protein